MLSIANILRNLNYDVQYNAGDLSFSDGKNNYALDCTEETDALFFGKLSATFDYDKVVTYERVNQFSLSHNYKATKVVQSDTGYSLRCEFYFLDPDFIYESVGLFVGTIRKAESMLVAKCKSFEEEKSLAIDSLKTTVQSDSIPSKILGAIHIVSNYAVGDSISVFVRVYRDNALLVNDSSPKDYSFIDRIIIAENKNDYHLLPFELPEASGQKASIRYEIWDNRGQCLIANYLND